jgi:tripartite-type tricarboxylate transporter receptor subunit TctC
LLQARVLRARKPTPRGRCTSSSALCPAARRTSSQGSARLGQQFIIENRPGAGGNIGTEAVVRAPADGHTLLLVTTANTISTTFYDNLAFNFMRDIAPAAAIVRVPNVVVVHPSVPATTVVELIAYAKAHPGKVNMASSGNGTTSHVSGEMFKMMTGSSLVHVPFRGGAQALTALLGGQVQVMFDSIPSSIGHIRAGELRPLAVTTATHSDVLPELPTVAEVVPGYEASTWYGLGAPRNTPADVVQSPADVVQSLNAAVNAALADPGMKSRLAEMGGIVLAGSPADFGRLIAEETEKWAQVVQFSGAKQE